MSCFVIFCRAPTGVRECISLHDVTYLHDVTANLWIKILDFRGFDSSKILMLRGGILMSIGNFPGKLESSNLSREILSREIGRTGIREKTHPCMRCCILARTGLSIKDMTGAMMNVSRMIMSCFLLTHSLTHSQVPNSPEWAA